MKSVHNATVTGSSFASACRKALCLQKNAVAAFFAFSLVASAQNGTHPVIKRYEAMVEYGLPRIVRVDLEPFTDEEKAILDAAGDYAKFNTFSEEHRLAYIKFWRDYGKKTGDDGGGGVAGKDTDQATKTKEEERIDAKIDMATNNPEMVQTEVAVEVDPALARAVELLYKIRMVREFDDADRTEAKRLFLDYLERHPESPFRVEIYFRIGEMYSRASSASFARDYEESREWHKKAVDAADPELYSQYARASLSFLSYSSWGKITFDEILKHYDWLLRFENITVDTLDPTADLIEHTQLNGPIDRRSHPRGRWTLQRMAEKSLPPQMRRAIFSCEAAILKRSQDPSEWLLLTERYPDRRLGIEAGKRLRAWKEGEFDPTDMVENLLPTLAVERPLPESSSELGAESGHSDSVEEPSKDELAEGKKDSVPIRSVKYLDLKGQAILVLSVAFILASFFFFRRLGKKRPL